MSDFGDHRANQLKPLGVVVLALMIGCLFQLGCQERVGTQRGQSVDIGMPDIEMSGVRCRSVNGRVVPVTDLSAFEQASIDQISDLEDKIATLSRDQLGSVYGELGMVYQCLGVGPPSRVCYLTAAELSPDDYRWPFLLAHLDRVEGKRVDAVGNFQNALKMMKAEGAPSKMQCAALNWMGDLAWGDNQLKQASKYFNASLALDSTQVFAMYSLARIAERKDDLESAAEWLEKAMGLHPDQRTIEYLLGNVYRRQGKVDQAKQLLESSVGTRPVLHPSDPLLASVQLSVHSHHRLAELATQLFESKEYVMAASLLRRALDYEASTQKTVSTLSNLGIALMKSGDPVGADKVWRQAIKIDNGHIPTMHCIARLALSRGEYSAGVKFCRSILAKDPGHVATRQLLGDLLSKDRQYALAHQEYKQLLELDPGNRTARASMTRMLILQGRYDDAISDLEQELEDGQHDAMFRHDLARLLATCPSSESRDPDRALQLALEVARQQPAIIHFETVAMAHAASGNFDESVQWQRSAIRLARQKHRVDLRERLLANLKLYEAERPFLLEERASPVARKSMDAEAQLR